MKTYEQTTNNILQRVEALQVAKVKRNRRILSVTTSLGCVAVITLLGNVIWLRGNHQAPPQPSGSVVTDPNNDPAPQDAPVVDVPASKEESKVESKAESKVESIVESEPKKPVESEPKDEQPMDTPLVDEPLNEDGVAIDNTFPSFSSFESFLKKGNYANVLQNEFINVFRECGNFYYQPVLGSGNDLLKFSGIEARETSVQFHYYIPDGNLTERTTLSIVTHILTDSYYPGYTDFYISYKEGVETGSSGYQVKTIDGIAYYYRVSISETYAPNSYIHVAWKQYDNYHFASVDGQGLTIDQLLPLLKLKKVQIKDVKPLDGVILWNRVRGYSDLVAFVKKGKADTEPQRAVLSALQAAGHYYRPVLKNGDAVLKLTSIGLRSYGLEYSYKSEDLKNGLVININFKTYEKDRFEQKRQLVQNKYSGYHYLAVDGIEYFCGNSQQKPSDPSNLCSVQWMENGLYHSAYFSGDSYTLEQVIPLLKLEKVEIQ